jgi:diguanylate cyclase (GGDEF)-like protein
LQGALRQGSGRDRDVVSRLGGDEFAIVLAGAGESEARTVADRILVAMAEPVPVGAVSARIGATIGIAVSRPGGEPDAAVRDADQAMYEAKRAGRGTYALAG